MDIPKISAAAPAYTGTGAAKPNPDQTQPKQRISQEQLRQDRVELSQKAIEQAQAALAKKDADNRKRSANTLSAMMQNSREQADAQTKPMQQIMKCLKIASRIMDGDIVPLKDESYLMEHQMDMYMRAIMMRRLKEDPEEHKSILNKDDEEDTATTSAVQAGTASAPASAEVSAPPAPPAEVE